MGGEAFRVVVDFEDAALRRFVAVKFDQFGIDFFEILGHVLAENLVFLRIHSNDEVVRRDGFVAAEHAQHFSHIADSDVVWVCLEGFIKQLLRLI